MKLAAGIPQTKQLLGEAVELCHRILQILTLCGFSWRLEKVMEDKFRGCVKFFRLHLSWEASVLVWLGGWGLWSVPAMALGPWEEVLH